MMEMMCFPWPLCSILVLSEVKTGAGCSDCARPLC